MALPLDEERSKLAYPFYHLEHHEKDLNKKKEAKPVLVRLQRVSDARHSDEYGLNKALRAKLRERVAEEESAVRKMGLSIRLLPASEEDAAIALGSARSSCSAFENLAAATYIGFSPCLKVFHPKRKLPVGHKRQQNDMQHSDREKNRRVRGITIGKLQNAVKVT
ncbi:hypothetical protein LguiA_000522 [Lonicera macranthoides]